MGLLFLKFFFFFILRCSKHCKIFSDYFPKYKQTLEKQSFSLKSFTFTNILRWRMFYVETNGAVNEIETVYCIEFLGSFLDKNIQVEPYVEWGTKDST